MLLFLTWTGLSSCQIKNVTINITRSECKTVLSSIKLKSKKIPLQPPFPLQYNINLKEHETPAYIINHLHLTLWHFALCHFMKKSLVETASLSQSNRLEYYGCEYTNTSP